MAQHTMFKGLIFSELLSLLGHSIADSEHRGPPGRFQSHVPLAVQLHRVVVRLLLDLPAFLPIAEHRHRFPPVAFLLTYSRLSKNSPSLTEV